MGSDYDFFGRASHTYNYNFSEEILQNRKLLREGKKLLAFPSYNLNGGILIFTE